MTDVSKLLKGFDKLDEKNWFSWKLNVQLALINAKVWKFVEPTTVKPAPEGTAEEKALALSIIRFSMNNDQLQYVGTEMDPRLAWSMLTKAKESKSGMALVTKLTELLTIKQAEETVTDHCSRISGLKRELDDLIDRDHEKFTKALYAALLIRSLNPQYEAFTVNVLQSEADKLDFDDIVRRAKLEEQRQNDRTASLTSNESAANVASSNVKQGKRFCSYHHREGHNDSECYNLHPELRPANWKAGRNSPTWQKTKQIGNLAEVHYATMASGTGKLTPATNWLIDSAATTHMCNDRTLFSNMKSVPTNTIVFGGGQSTKANEAGDIEALVKLDGTEFTTTIRNVLYVPGLKRNLLSMVLWAKQGITCSPEVDGSFTVRHNAITVGRVTGRNNLLPVIIFPAKKLNVHAAATATVYPDNGTLWHHRLGHVNSADMKRLAAMSYGLGSTSFDGDCDSCAMGKLHAQPFPHSTTHRAQQPLELIHTDLCGPLPATRDGFRYFISFIDDHTRFAEVRLLRDKSEAMDAFIGYKSWTERATQRGIKMLRSDGAGEYLSKQFNEWLGEEGIQRQVSAPYSQQQNGVSERYNRTVVESARAMLHHSGLDATYWSDAVLTACHVRNRMPTAALDNQTPFEAFHGHKPSLDHLRVFGCRAFALIDKSKRTKFDVKARPCVHLGYAQGYKAYRLLDTATRRIFVSRHVRFVEHRFLNALGDRSASSVGADMTRSTAVSPIQLTNALEANDAGQVEAAPASSSVSTAANSSDPAPATSSVQAAPQPLSQSTPAPRTGSWRKSHTVDPTASIKLGEIVTNVVRNQPELTGRLNEVARLQLQNLADTHKVSIKQLTQKLKQAVKEQPEQLEELTTHEACVTEIDESLTVDPKSHREAMSCPDAEKWRKAELDEMDSIARAATWKLVELPVGRKAIDCKWVYKTKFDQDGNVERAKARLVAKGYTQQHGVDFDETFSPVLRYSSLRALLALTAYYDLELEQMDVKTAYLNGTIDYDIYMKQPQGHEVKGKENLVCKLEKSLYGLKQAGRTWYERINSELERMKFTRLQTEHCTYIKQTNESIVVIGLYVDDLVLISNSLDELSTIKKQLAAIFEMKDLGNAKFVLGIKIERDRTNKALSISQSEYINNVVRKFGMEDSRRETYTPMNPGMRLVKSGLFGEDESKSVDATQYQAAVGSIMYAMLGTRPDIGFSISRLAQYSNDPREQHWNAVKQLVRYLATTSNYCLTYRGEANNTAEPELTVYTDSDWAADHDTRRSTTGYLFLFAGAPISWKSKRQPTVALSTTEAEYMAACEATREAMNWRMFLGELGLDTNNPTIIMSDNQGSIALSKNPEHHARSKHIHIRHHYVREQVLLGTVKFEYVSTNEMTADILTKALSRDRHALLTKKMGIDARPIARIHSLSGSVEVGNGGSAS